ncbi:MAG: hypothetical protein KIT84_40935 [Labilithrix sp.]|nr:hypothetical protein [Labilithrix sp.]MCW5817436.1 hypothetical protein [Labilithrix sp.]
MMFRSFFALAFSTVAAAVVAACSAAPDDSNGAAAQANGATNAAGQIVTFNKHVMPLLQQHCQACHHEGGFASFALDDYATVKAFRNIVKSAVVSGRMPEARSIRLDTGCSNADTFSGARRLTAEEIGVFVSWADSGAPEGDPADLPPPIDWRDPQPGEWITGTPDWDLQNTPDGFVIPPRVPRDIFRRFPYKTNYETDRFITAVEAIPDNGSWAGKAGSFPIVHHMEIWIDPTGKSLEQEQRYQAAAPNIAGPGFEGEWDFPETPLLIGMWVPGADPPAIPKGYGYRLPKGATIVFEIHYAGDRVNEFAINDRSRWGIHFSDHEVKPFTSLVTRNERFDVPANVSSSQAEWKHTFDRPVTLHGITPHMHQLGTFFHLEIERPGQPKNACLADLQWDFEHQNAYFLNQPIDLPAGSSIKWLCEYDNTDGNPRQFNHPPQDVRSGPTSRDEMCQLTMHWTDQP